MRFRTLSLLLIASIAPLWAQPGTPATTAADIQQSLHKLNELGSILMIAAHPDDERTEVLVYFARGRYMRSGYLSMTRGEGGQNLIGSEQGVALGVIRTQELLAARRMDGAEQFFSRAIDFGFSKTPEETLKKWGHDRVLADTVWVIRRYRPDVVILGFSGTAADGHGQHQASAILGKEAFAAAGDATKFPEQLKYVSVWKPSKIVGVQGGGGGGRGGPAGGPPPAPPIVTQVPINTTGFNPLIGYTYAQLSTLSRSQHRSQGFGNVGNGGPPGGGRGGPGGASGASGGGRGQAQAAAPPPPPATPPAPPVDLFEGIDHSWNRFAGGARAGALLAQALKEFDAEHPEKTIPLLVQARPIIAGINDPLAKIKLVELDETIAKCAGVLADAQARSGDVAPGAHVPVTVTFTSRIAASEVKLTSVRPEGLWAGKTFTATAAPRIPDYDLEVPAAQAYTQPYWLVKKPTDGMYTVDDQMLVGLPDSPVEQMRFSMTVGGAAIEVVRPIVYRYDERLEGPKMRNLAVVPAVAVNVPLAPDLSSQVTMFPEQTARKLQVTLKGNVANAQGSLRLELPAGWKSTPANQTFKLAAFGDQEELTFTITPPAGESVSNVRAVATVAGKEIANGMTSISYVHFPRQNLFPQSEMKVVRSDIHVTAKHVGYIMGAGDEIPAALRQLGIEVSLLGEDDLRKSDLSHFDAIVAGVRAYDVRADLRASHARLLEYVNNGGTYVVQYVRDGGQNIGPYPMTIPNNNNFRVTVEEAPVTFADPDSPLLQRPNKIVAKDFEGWVQERGIYFASQWDPRYKSVLSTGDPGEKALEGGELWTRYGKGVYIFSSWVWFRELPAGVPGAYRMFANLLSAKY